MSGAADDDFDKLMKELDGEVGSTAPAPTPTPARRNKKTATVITDEKVNPEPALAAAIADAPAAAPEPAPEPTFVKIAGMKVDEPETVTVTVIENAPPKEPYLSPQTLAEMEAGRAVLNRFK